MKPDEIHLSDWYRLLFGQAPATFLIEVAVRAVVTYVLLLVAMRLMGRRVAGQMSGTEITIVVTLGAAIGVPLQAPDRGMAPAVVILLVALLYQRGIGRWAFWSRRAEVVIQGDVVTVVSEGRLNLDTMRGSVMSRERLFSALRQAGVMHLGQLKRVYLEADGHFSIFRIDEPVPGLCVMPEQDQDLFVRQFTVDGSYACKFCGNVVDGQSREPGQCPRCNQTYWSPSVQDTHFGSLKLAKEINGGD